MKTIRTITLASILILTHSNSLLAEEVKKLPVTEAQVPVSATQQSARPLDVAVTANPGAGIPNAQNGVIQNGAGVQAPGSNVPRGACPRIGRNNMEAFVLQNNQLRGRSENIARGLESIELTSMIARIEPFTSSQWVSILDSSGCRYEFPYDSQTGNLRLMESLQQAIGDPSVRWEIMVTSCQAESNYCLAYLTGGRISLR